MRIATRKHARPPEQLHKLLRADHEGAQPQITGGLIPFILWLPGVGQGKRARLALLLRARSSSAMRGQQKRRLLQAGLQS